MPDPIHEEALAQPLPGTILTVEREFDAPRKSVWMSWTDPEQVKLWWAPEGFTTSACRISLRIGGAFFVCMRSPDGRDFCNIAFYREIVAPERISASMSFADLQGNVVPATTYGMSSDFPQEMLLTVTFEEAGGKTKMTLTHVGIPPGDEMENAREGWNQSFDKLAAALAADKAGRG
jgi:uncharacterized protein YndB with AHSA1/START domain